MKKLLSWLAVPVVAILGGSAGAVPGAVVTFSPMFPDFPGNLYVGLGLTAAGSFALLTYLVWQAAPVAKLWACFVCSGLVVFWAVWSFWGDPEVTRGELPLFLVPLVCGMAGQVAVMLFLSRGQSAIHV